VTRRRRWQRSRLPGRRAARRARSHGRERLPGRCTPVPSRGARMNLKVAVAGRMPPGPRAGARARRVTAACPGHSVEHLKRMYPLSM
jgi:hypothetical protein